MGSKVNFIDKVLARIDRLDRENIQTYVTGFVREKKETEQMLDHMGEGILLLNREGVVRYANRNAFLWLGFSRLMKGRSRIEDLVKEPPLRHFILNRLRRAHHQATEEFQVLTPREMDLRLHWIPIEADEEKLVIIRIENLSQTKGSFEEDARLQRIESLIRLAAGVAHEIGNPLNSIQIHIELLKQEVAQLAKSKQASLYKLIDVLRSETTRLDQIVRSFLHATRNPPLRFRVETINEIIEEAVEFLRYEIEKNNILVKLKLDREMPRFLLDRNRLYQVFINLIKNGMDAMPTGGELTISTSVKDKLCLVQIQDRGEGIEPKDLPHIFEAYYTTKQEGSGLGLTQVYQAIHEHGGRIDVKSEPGHGSVFSLILPIRKEQLSLPQPRATHERVI